MKTLIRIVEGFAAFVLAVALIVWLASGSVHSKRYPASAGIIQYDVCRDAQDAPPPPPSVITIATYNIGYASGAKNNLPVELGEHEVRANLEAIVSSLAAIDPDIVVLQEVDFDAQRTFGIDQMAFLARGLCMPYAAYAILWNKRYVPWPYWPPRFHFGRIVSGMAILSTFPLTAHEVTRFEKPRENRIWYNWFYVDRGTQHATVTVGETAYDIWNVHLEAFKTATRHEQLGILAKTVDGASAAAIVAGDFNEEIGTKLTAFAAATNLTRADITTDLPRRVDHIFYRGDAFRPKAGGFLTLNASDHVPVWVQLAALPAP